MREPASADRWDALAGWLRGRGLATPALMLVGMARPLGFAAGQCLSLLEAVVPQPRWQTAIAQMAAELEDEATWTRLEKLLQ